MALFSNNSYALMDNSDLLSDTLYIMGNHITNASYLNIYAINKVEIDSCADVPNLYVNGLPKKYKFIDVKKTKKKILCSITVEGEKNYFWIHKYPY